MLLRLTSRNKEMLRIAGREVKAATENKTIKFRCDYKEACRVARQSRRQNVGERGMLCRN